MNQTFHAHVIGASRYKMENGHEGANVLLIQDAGEDNENRIGKEVMTASAKYEILHKMKEISSGQWPQYFELDVRLKTVSTKTGPKAGLEILDVRPAIGRGALDKQAKPAAADKA